MDLSEFQKLRITRKYCWHAEGVAKACQKIQKSCTECLIRSAHVRELNLSQRNDQITRQATKFRYFTRQKLKSRQLIIIAIQAYFKKKEFERKRNTRLSINRAILSHFREKDISALKKKVMRYQVNSAIARYNCNWKNLNQTITNH